MTKRPATRLSLSVETLRDLSTLALSEVRGGVEKGRLTQKDTCLCTITCQIASLAAC